MYMSYEEVKLVDLKTDKTPVVLLVGYLQVMN